MTATMFLRPRFPKCHSEEPLHFQCHPERSEGSTLVTFSSADVFPGAGYATRNLLRHLRRLYPFGAAGHFPESPVRGAPSLGRVGVASAGRRASGERRFTTTTVRSSSGVRRRVK